MLVFLEGLVVVHSRIPPPSREGTKELEHSADLWVMQPLSHIQLDGKFLDL